MTSLKMAWDKITVADLKLFNRSLNEFRYAARTFAPYRSVKKVCVFGSARTAPTEPEFQAAVEFSRRMVEHGYMSFQSVRVPFPSVHATFRPVHVTFRPEQVSLASVQMS